jgi:pyruvate-ferredoxin/flavodoxin oxidoreductase
LLQGVAESMTREGPALYRIHAPDPVRDGLAAESIVEVARLAVESRAVPLFVARPEGARAGLSLAGNPDPEENWTTHELVVKEPSGVEARVSAFLTVADWAARQARFRHHFKVVSRGNRSAQMKPLAEYLSLAPDAREGFEPYIDVRDREGRHAVAVVSAEIVRATERAAAAWTHLRAAAANAPPAGSRAAPVAATEAVAASPAPAARPGADALRTLTESLLRLSGYGQDETFFKRRLREFVAQDRGGNGEPA